MYGSWIHSIVDTDMKRHFQYYNVIQNKLNENYSIEILYMGPLCYLDVAIPISNIPKNEGKDVLPISKKKA